MKAMRLVQSGLEGYKTFLGIPTGLGGGGGGVVIAALNYPFVLLATCKTFLDRENVCVCEREREGEGENMSANTFFVVRRMLFEVSI